MIQSIRAQVLALMNKLAGNTISGVNSDIFTLAQATNSNDDQIQGLLSAAPTYIYKAVISQGGTSEPNPDYILINTFPATPAFTYLNVGDYSLTFTGFDPDAFNYNTIQGSLVKSSGLKGSIKVEYVGSGVFGITNYDNGNSPDDDLMEAFTIVIEAYPV